MKIIWIGRKYRVLRVSRRNKLERWYDYRVERKSQSGWGTCRVYSEEEPAIAEAVYMDNMI